MDNEQQAAMLALIITALKTAKMARELGLMEQEPLKQMLRSLENDALEALESLPEVTP